MIEEITIEYLHENLKEAQLPVLVDFYQEGCGPCRLLAPKLNELAKTYKGQLEVWKVEGSRQPRLLAKEGIKHFPTLILYVNGKKVNRSVGNRGSKQLRDMVAPVLS